MYHKMSAYMSARIPGKKSQIECQNMSEYMSGRISVGWYHSNKAINGWKRIQQYPKIDDQYIIVSSMLVMDHMFLDIWWC